MRWWRDHQLSIFDPAVRERIVKQAPDREQGEAHFELMTRYFETHLERGRRFSWSLTVPAHTSNSATPCLAAAAI